MPVFATHSHPPSKVKLTITEKQLSAIPGIGAKSAWKLIGERVKLKRKDSTKSFPDVQSWFSSAGLSWQEDFAPFFND